MIFIKFRVRPNASTVKFTQYGGAYIGCWIKIGSKKVAEARALAKILEEGRIVEHREELKVLKAPHPTKARKFIERAKVEGLSFKVRFWLGKGSGGGLLFNFLRTGIHPTNSSS